MRTRIFCMTFVALVAHVTCGGESSTSAAGGGQAGADASNESVSGGTAGIAGNGGATGGTSATGGAGAVGGSGGMIQDSSIDYMSPNPYLDAGEDQWCKPDPGPGAVTSCCGSMPCNGGCLTSGTSKTCDCFGIPGGCPQDLICCLVKKGCTAAGSCQLGL